MNNIWAVEREPEKIKAWSRFEPLPLWAMTGGNALAIKPIKPTGEQTTVSSIPDQAFFNRLGCSLYCEHHFHFHFFIRNSKYDF